jgi:hypothetical protein
VYLVDQALFQFHADGIHELVEKAHGDGEDDPFRMGRREVPMQLDALVIGDGGGDRRQRARYRDCGARPRLGVPVKRFGDARRRRAPPQCE